MKKNKNLVELPLEMLGIARSKCESINQVDDDDSKESKSASNMIGKIHTRATEELKCYVRVAMMRTGFEYNLANDCSPLDKNSGIRIRMTRSEFFDTYISIFDMSDGSNIDNLYSDNSTGKMTLKGSSSLNYTSSLLRLVGVEELSPAGESDMMTFQVCGIDMVKIFMLGIVGNFVTSDKKDEASNGLAKVVIDVYTGRLTLVNSFSVVRSYFLETMLIISILAIAKLTIIRNVKAVVFKST